VVGVLAYDAVTAAGADFLQRQHDELVAHTNKELLDLVDAISLYF
jgi:hypothetical protein